MFPIDYAHRERPIKVVYWGAPLSGRSSSYHRVHMATQPIRRGKGGHHYGHAWNELELRPRRLAPIEGFGVRVHLFAPHSREHFVWEPEAYLRGAAAVIFVADAQPERMGANREALAALQTLTAALPIPRVLQINKLDLVGGHLSEAAQFQQFAEDAVAVVGSCATNGQGIGAALNHAIDAAYKGLT